MLWSLRALYLHAVSLHTWLQACKAFWANAGMLVQIACSSYIQVAVPVAVADNAAALTSEDWQHVVPGLGSLEQNIVSDSSLAEIHSSHR